MTVIEAVHLTKEFSARPAVEDLSLTVEKGEAVGFLGPNGAGKTTTVRMFAGIIAPTSGYAVVNSIRTDQDTEQLHQTTGLLTETPGFYEKLTAQENLMYFAGFYQIDGELQVEKYLRKFQLWNRRHDKVGTFSKGMKQRLALARALLHEPDVLFLDEPTAGLDPRSAREVRDLIAQFKKEGKTIFLCTHNLEEAEQLCDRIAVFQTRLVALDTAENLRTQLFKREVVVELDTVTDAIIKTVQNLPFVESVRSEENSLTVELQRFNKNRPALVRSIVEKDGQIQSVYEKKHSLEEVYLALVEEEKGDTI